MTIWLIILTIIILAFVLSMVILYLIQEKLIFYAEKLHKDYEMKIKFDRGAAPWITPITHPVFPIALEALKMGFDRKACIFGCGGSIPFVAKLTDAIPRTQPLCLGPYDPDSRMHEPGESLSMTDLLGCAKSILHLIARINKAF